MDIMDSQKIGCLPVVKNNRLVGIITEQNYMKIAARLIRVLHLNKDDEESGSDEEQ
jgi:predicted transcriptional regulator